MRRAIYEDDVIKLLDKGWKSGVYPVASNIHALPSAQPEDDRLERCKFEYLNACKTVTFPTPDTSKSDIYDAYAVIKALHPIFGDVEF